MNSLFLVNLLIGCGMLLLTYPACCCQKQCFLLACSWSLGPLKPKKRLIRKKISELLLRDFCFVYLFAWVAWYGNLAGQNLAAGSLCLLPN